MAVSGNNKMKHADDIDAYKTGARTQQPQRRAASTLLQFLKACMQVSLSNHSGEFRLKMAQRKDNHHRAAG